MVEQSVDLDPGLCFTEFGPREEAQAEAYRSRVKRVELVLELKLVLGSKGLTTTVDLPEQGLEEGGRAVLVGLRKSRSGRRFCSQVIEVGFPGTHGSNPVSE